jgi:hypothetical protein
MDYKKLFLEKIAYFNQGYLDAREKASVKRRLNYDYMTAEQSDFAMQYYNLGYDSKDYKLLAKKSKYIQGGK